MNKKLLVGAMLVLSTSAALADEIPTTLSYKKDGQGAWGPIIVTESYTNQVLIASASVSYALTCPTGTKAYCLEDDMGNYYSKANGSSTRPTGTVSDGSAWPKGKGCRMPTIVSGTNFDHEQVQSPSVGNTVRINCWY